MKKSLIVLILILFSNVVSGQFSCSINGTAIRSNISLFENSKYLIDLKYIDNDGDIVQTPLSAGTYFNKKDTIFLTDIYLNYIFIFIRKGNQLMPINGFSWMSTLVLDKGKSEYDDQLLQFATDPLKYFKISHTKKLNLEKLNLTNMLEYIYGEYSVVLTKPNNYVCKFGGLILSEGIFECKNNEFVFFDKNLGFSFSCFINHDSICVNLLPFQNTCLGLK